MGAFHGEKRFRGSEGESLLQAVVDALNALRVSNHKPLIRDSHDPKVDGLAVFVVEEEDVAENRPFTNGVLGDATVERDIEVTGSVGIQRQRANDDVGLVAADDTLVDAGFFADPAAGEARFLIAADEGEREKDKGKG